jgi:predicted RNase H-like HicB family nuclease
VEINIMNFKLELEQEEDGRWLAEVVGLPGVLAYGANADEAMVKAESLALRAIAERLEHGESRPMSVSISFDAA